MAQDIEMPALGESVTEGTVSRWLKKVGDQVAVDEPLLEVSTDKVDSEVPSPIAGVITEILVEEDETVDVGTVVCRVGAADEVGSAAPAAPAAPAVPAAPPASPAASPVPQTPAASSAPAGGGQAVEMPALGESVTEGTVSRWLKKVGDKVEVDEPLLEVSTDKVDSEVPSPIAGVVTEILVQEDETVDVGTVLCRVGDGAAAPAETSAPAAPEASAAPAAPAVPAAPPAPSLPENPAELPGAGIPSSIKREGDHHVVQWAYPQVHTGYPGTMTVEGQVVPPSDNAPAVPAVPAVPAAPAAPPAPKVAETPAAPKPPAAPPAPAAPKAPAAPTPPAAAPSAKPEEKPQAAKQVSGGYVTPIVRKLAREKGVDISTLKGSGVGGRIRREDVLAA
uniref:biotin/lipoyl-containing protein n=1 Tax=uncultured Varibaculum sp. TaxID=413896 RepID=UPI00288BD2D3